MFLGTVPYRKKVADYLWFTMKRPSLTIYY